MSEPNYIRSYNFLFEMQGLRVATFSNVSGLAIQMDVIEVRDGGDPAYVRTLPGLVRYPRITLSWGVTTSSDMWDWMNTAINGQVSKKDAAIICIGSDGQTEMLRYNMTGVWPCAWTGCELDASRSEAAIEHMTLVAETLERVTQGPAQAAGGA